MKKCRKMISLVLALMLCAALLCACGDGNTRVVFTTGLGKEDVFRIGGETCRLPELMV